MGPALFKLVAGASKFRPDTVVLLLTLLLLAAPARVPARPLCHD